MRITIVSLLAAVPATMALGHGSMGYPISRTYSGYLEGPESPQSDAIQDAVECGGTQPLYDWHQVANFFPGNAAYQQTIAYEQEIPDGRLASGNNPIYYCYDAPRSDWPATQMTSGVTELTWAAWVVHNPSVFNVWITTPDWDPTTELNWAQMEELELGPVTLIDNEYKFEVDIPEREGRHVLYCIWQRLDPAGEGFYSTSDIVFGPDDGDDGNDDTDDGNDDTDDGNDDTDDGNDDTDDGNDDTDDGNDDDPDGQGTDSASISLVDSWDGSWHGRMTVTNSDGTLPMLNWNLSWNGGPEFSSLWNGVLSSEGDRTVVDNEHWNGYVEAGQSTSFEFIAIGTWPPTFSNVRLNGLDIDLDGASNDDSLGCDGDVNLDSAVDVLDVLLVLDNWNSTEPGNASDLDGDGVVAVGDVLIILEGWGTCP
jgi:chitin-binding protein